MANDMAEVCNAGGMAAWLYLVRFYERMQRHSSVHMWKYDLTPAQYDVLAQLSDAPGITQQELAERLMVTKGNICGLIDRMSARGYVERREDPEDRRTNLLYLTHSGEKVATEAIPAYGEFVRDHMSALSEQDLATLEEMLRKLDEGLDRH